MGYLLDAYCDCGFKQRITLGGGMSNFKVFCGAPAYCKFCKEMVNLNYLDKKHICPKCNQKIVFYNDVSLQRASKDKKSELIEWNTDNGPFILPEVLYFCPKCQDFQLRFRIAILFD